MKQKVLEQAEIICEAMFPDNEIGQCLLYHYLAGFADFVEVYSLLAFREEMKTTSLSAYVPEEVKHG